MGHYRHIPDTLHMLSRLTARKYTTHSELLQEQIHSCIGPRYCQLQWAWHVSSGKVPLSEKHDQNLQGM